MLLKVMGRPKRKRRIERANYKLDSGIRNLFKERLEKKRMTEGIGVERAMLHVVAFDNLISRNEQVTLESVEKEIEALWISLLEASNNEDEETNDSP